MEATRGSGGAESVTAQSDATKITVEGRDGSSLDLYVLEETKMNGMFYLLAAESAEGDGECYILKDISKPEDADAVYEFVTDDAEAQYMLHIFQELIDGEDIQITEDRK